MKFKTITHRDKRRVLVEFMQDIPIRTSKILFMKETAVLGNHYHKRKDDLFYLVKGGGSYTLDGKKEQFKKGDCLFVERGTVHSFKLKKGSILIESSTTPYDKEDEYKI